MLCYVQSWVSAQHSSGISNEEVNVFFTTIDFLSTSVDQSKEKSVNTIAKYYFCKSHMYNVLCIFYKETAKHC